MVANDFVKSWGATEQKPQFVYTEVPPSPEGTLSVIPRFLDTAVKETLSVLGGRQELGVHYQGAFDKETWNRFRQQLRIPATMEVESVSLLRPTGQQTVRWARPHKDQLTVFLPRAIDDAYRLTILGRVPLPASGKLKVPILTTASHPAASRELLLFRQDGVLVNLEGSAEVISSPDITVPTGPFSQARLVGAYALDPQRTEEAVIEVTPKLGRGRRENANDSFPKG